jgi:hypothetical protein
MALSWLHCTSSVDEEKKGVAPLPSRSTRHHAERLEEALQVLHARFAVNPGAMRTAPKSILLVVADSNLLLEFNPALKCIVATDATDALEVKAFKVGVRQLRRFLKNKQYPNKRTHPVENWCNYNIHCKTSDHAISVVRL